MPAITVTFDHFNKKVVTFNLLQISTNAPLRVTDRRQFVQTILVRTHVSVLMVIKILTMMYVQVKTIYIDFSLLVHCATTY